MARKKPKKKPPPRKRPAAPAPASKAAPAPALKAPPLEENEGLESDGSLPFPVVGMAASAGGLDAFKRFFTAVSSETGMAFILIPHLDPTHESLMVDLVGRQTSLPVVEAREGMKVEMDHVYIIPPNKYLTIGDGVLRLTGPVERRGLSTPIDLFLRSLADDLQERAICIVLSGTGAHGTLGLKAVKANGGMAIVQDPKTAEYDRMPANAVATGLADFVLPPDKMPEALRRYARHFYVNGGNGGDGADGKLKATDYLPKILAVLQTRTKHDFNLYRKRMLMRRIERRMGLGQIDDLPAYLAHLRTNPDEVKHLTRDLLISVTSFFRDAEAFQALEKDVVPGILQARPTGDGPPLRVWVPGAATGEEAYSLAMLFLERMTIEQKRTPLQVFASDVDADALEVARLGIYPESIAADVTPERLNRFFTRPDDHTYQVNKQLRESVVFARQNLIAEPPFSKMDLISCRNLLIYLEPEVQKRVIALFHFALNDGGYLFLGPSETIGRQIDLFETVNKKWRIFRRLGPARPDRVEFPISGRESEPRESRRPAAAGGARLVDFAEVAQRVLLETFAPAAILINRRTYEVLYFFGQTMRYLDQPTGHPTQDLMVLARDGLRTKLRALIQKAVHDAAPVEEHGVRVKREGAYVLVKVRVVPVHAPRIAEGLLLVSFEDEPWPTPPPPSPRPAESAADESAVSQLEYELRATREDLQSTIEEMESANEELKASNEEVMSMNEELQSANEELETSKEELQSLNEELNTVNSQLHDKLDELESANNDMANLLNCTDIGTVFLDRVFRIKRYTPAAMRMFNLIASDVGRPLHDIAQKFVDPELLQDAERVQKELAPIEKEVPVENGQWCIRRILPYRTLDNRIEGVVITFVDITEGKRAEQELQRLNAVLERRFADQSRDMHDVEEAKQNVLDTAAEGIISIDDHGTILSFNQAAERMFGYQAGEVVGRSLKVLMPPPHRDRFEYYLARFESTGEPKMFGTRREVQARRRDGSIFPADLAVSETREDGRHVFTGIMRDISERRAMERQVLEIAAAEQRRIGQDLHDIVGQELTGLGLMVQSLTESFANKTGVEAETFKKIVAGLQRALKQVRLLSSGLNLVEVDSEGLMSALTALAQRVNDLDSVAASFTCARPVLIDDNAVATQFFYIAQEAVTNVLKHGRARHVWIDLAETDDKLVLTVRDDGLGIDKSAGDGKGMGMKIMNHRASLIGATLAVKSRTDGKGTEVVCSLTPSETGS